MLLSQIVPLSLIPKAPKFDYGYSIVYLDTNYECVDYVDLPKTIRNSALCSEHGVVSDALDVRRITVEELFLTRRPRQQCRQLFSGEGTSSL